MNDFNKSIGEQLRNKRKSMKLSCQDMSDLLNCAKSTYSYYERGVTSIAIDDLIVVCNYLGLNWVEVVYNAEKERK